jgi:hypothetical protein
MILGLGEHDALGGHQLGGLGGTTLQRHLHGLDEGLAQVAHDGPAGGLPLGIEAELAEDLLDDSNECLRVEGLGEVVGAGLQARSHRPMSLVSAPGPSAAAPVI